MTYWDTHYRNGGRSGDPTDYLAQRKIRTELFDSIICENDTILDLGCGDLQAWYGRPLGANYIGVDISETIIERNRSRYPDARFYHLDLDDVHRIPGSFDIITCFDVLFHVMDDYTYDRILTYIAANTRKCAIISTWDRNYMNGILPRLMRLKNTGEFTIRENTTDGKYQKYRRFEEPPKYFTGYNRERVSDGLYVFRRCVR